MQRLVLCCLISSLGCDPVAAAPDSGTAPIDGGSEGADVAMNDAGVLDSADAGGLDAPSDGASLEDAPATDGGRMVSHVTITPLADACATMPIDYGDYGPVTEYDRHEFDNPAWPGPDGQPVVVFAPSSAATERPVLFYSHAYGGTDWRRMLGFFEMLVSHDYIVVFVPYPTVGPSICGRYDILETGFSEAVARLSETTGMDTTRVGYLGHSFGGGASPRMAHVGLALSGYGSAGSFIFSSAPWYVYRMDEVAWSNLPSTRLLVMVYEDDTVNDHRMAIEQVFDPFVGTKDYLRLRSSTHADCVLDAGHGTPPTTDGIDALDTWGIWRHAHALAECTLRSDLSACAVIGDTDMGRWLDDDSVVEISEHELSPTPSLDSSGYTFPITGVRACGG